MPGPSPVVRARLKPELHKQFEALRLARGISESDLLKEAVTRELARFAEGERRGPAGAVVPTSDADTKRARVTIRLPAFIKKAATARAASRGFRLSPWISGLVQSHIVASPVLNNNELQILDASNRELAAVGRNINQIARVLNDAHYETEKVRLDILTKLGEQIEATRAAIRGLVRASRNTWGDDS